MKRIYDHRLVIATLQLCYRSCIPGWKINGRKYGREQVYIYILFLPTPGKCSFSWQRLLRLFNETNRHWSFFYLPRHLWITFFRMTMHEPIRFPWNISLLQIHPSYLRFLSLSRNFDSISKNFELFLENFIYFRINSFWTN